MKLKLLSILAIIIIALALTSPLAKAFNPFGDVCDQAPNSPTCQQNTAQLGKKTNPVVDIIRTAANIIAIVGGIAAVVVIIFSGFMFITAGGVAPGQRSSDPNRLKTARSALAGALIGLVIIALSWAIITFVTSRIIG